MSPEPSLLWKTLRVPARIGTTTLFDLKVYGKHHVPAAGGALLGANHQSFLDPILVGAQLRRPLSFMAKSELFEHRAFAWLIRSLNAFPVRQGAGDRSALELAIRLLQEGALLNMFPEGTRSPDGEIQAIEPGIALVIRRSGVPVVPAVIDGSFEAWKGRKIFRPWPIRVCYGPAMQLSGMDRKAVVRIVGEVLRGMLQALREERHSEDRGGQINSASLEARVCALSASLMQPAEPRAATGRQTPSAEMPAAKSASTA